jgi:hypothetical protein
MASDVVPQGGAVHAVLLGKLRPFYFACSAFGRAQLGLGGLYGRLEVCCPILLAIDGGLVAAHVVLRAAKDFPYRRGWWLYRAAEVRFGWQLRRQTPQQRATRAVLTGLRQRQRSVPLTDLKNTDLTRDPQA